MIYRPSSFFLRVSVTRLPRGAVVGSIGRRLAPGRALPIRPEGPAGRLDMHHPLLLHLIAERLALKLEISMLKQVNKIKV